MSAEKSTPDRFKRHAVKGHRGLTYRELADGSKSFHGFVKGKQVYVGASLREAVARYGGLREKSARGEQVVPTQLKFGVVAEQWYASKQSRLRPWTLLSYRSALDNVLLPRFGNFKLAQISTAHVASLIRDLEAKGLSRSTIDNYLKPLGGTFKFAMSRGLIGVNPMANLTEDERPPRKPRQVFEWSPESIEALLSASRELAAKPGAYFDYTPLLTFAIRTGCRLGESLGLRWEAVELTGDAPSLHVHHQITRLGELAAPKTPKAVRRIPLSPSMVKLLLEHKLASPFSQPTDFVFAGLSGGPLSHRNAQRRGFERAAKAAGIEGVTFHSMRHAAASSMIAAGLSPIVVADVLGHSSSSITLSVYAHMFDRQRTDDLVRNAIESAMSSESG